MDWRENSKRRKHQVSYLPDIHRTLPVNSEAERGILGSILLAPSIMQECQDAGITTDSFHIPAHKVIWSLLKELCDENEPIDGIILVEILTNRRQLESVGGRSFIVEICTFMPTAANAGYYIAIVKEKATLRKVITECITLVARAYSDQDEVETIVEEMEKAAIEVTKQSEGKVKIVTPTMKDSYFEVLDRLDAIASGTLPSGLLTGLHDLDRKLGGFHNGELIVISGTKGGGKTSLAHNITDHVAIALKRPVLIWSYEMKRLWVTSRIIAARGRIDTEHIRCGTLTEMDMASLSRIGHEVTAAPITIHDNADTTLDEMRRISRKWKADTDGALIVVDYLQKIPHGKNGKDSRQREVAQISDGLQKMAMELNIPIIALAQHNKNGELREAEDIGFDAKTVLKICRQQEDEDTPIEKEPVHVRRDIVINKNNNGGLGFIPVQFLKNFVKFVDLAREEKQPDLIPPKKGAK